MKLFRHHVWIGAAAVASLFLLIAGCRPAKNQETQGSSAGDAQPKITKADVAEGDADLLEGLPVGQAATNSILSEGDKAWREVLQALRPPPPPAEWRTNQPSKEAIAEFEKKTGLLAADVAGKVQDFYTRFPNHEKAGEARERERYLLGVAAQLGNTNVQKRLRELEEAKLKDPNLPEEERVQLRIEQLQRAAMGRDDRDMAAALRELEKGARALQKEFPNRHEPEGLLLSVAGDWLEQNNPEKARTLAAEAVNSREPEIQEAAQGLLKKLNRVGKPIEIKFKSIDGRDVDLQAMKGKVVLVDFWATWCGPCMAELPKVKTAYENLKPKGFEIVGISLDREKSALEKVVARENMSWPQHFDESGEGNKYADEFGIAAIPTMWLVDKRGNLRELNARENLEQKIEKLLAE